MQSLPRAGPQSAPSGAGAAADGSAPQGSQRSRLGGDADSATAEVMELWRKEAQQLRKAMQSRPTIDMARGVLMAVFSCSPEAAWEILVTVSQHSNTKLHEVAEAVVDTTTRQEPLPEEFQQYLAAASAVRRRG